MSYTTWRKEITQRMVYNEDKDINNYICNLTEEELDIEFDAGYGGEEGLSFTCWTTYWVYFPLCYDGSEWCGSVARNPNMKATRHQGGG
jgi:hypothetical protein